MYSLSNYIYPKPNSHLKGNPNRKPNPSLVGASEMSPIVRIVLVFTLLVKVSACFPDGTLQESLYMYYDNIWGLFGHIFFSRPVNSDLRNGQAVLLPFFPIFFQGNVFKGVCKHTRSVRLVDFSYPPAELKHADTLRTSDTYMDSKTKNTHNLRERGPGREVAS